MLRSTRSLVLASPTQLLIWLAAVCSVQFAAHLALAVPTHPGKWTKGPNGVYEMHSTAVNLVLLPGGPSGHHSRLMWWSHSDHEHIFGNIVGWTAPADAATNAGTFPSVNFVPLGLQVPPDQGSLSGNVFCAGQTLLADGRMLVSGGTLIGEVGTTSTLLFDPAADANGEWQRVDDMSQRRWYSNNTVLPDGRVVTVAGSTYNHYLAVGGRVATPADSQSRLLQRLGVASPSELWEPSVVPLKSVAPIGQVLKPVSDAAAADFGSSKMLIYGGVQDEALSNEGYVISRERNYFGPDYQFQWTPLNQTSDQLLKPSPSKGAALVAISPGKDYLYVGGRDDLGPNSEVWRGSVTNLTVTWTKLTRFSGPALPALHGASAVWDYKTARVFVFGGSSTSSETPSSANNKVYSLELGTPASGLYVVSEATVTGDNPGARSYASLVHSEIEMLRFPGNTTQYTRAYHFGGKTASGGLSDELRILWFNSPTSVEWQLVNAPGGSPRPAARAHHGAAFDRNSLRMVVSGGEVAAGGVAADVWGIDAYCPSGDCAMHPIDATWDSLQPLPVPVRGHATLALGPEAAVARFPEVYSPTATAGTRWTKLSSVPHWQEWYPFGFVVPRRAGDPPSGIARVFYAGPDIPSTTLTPDGTPSWTSLPADGANKAGSAVMYRPGRVMKSGTRDTGGTNRADVLGRTAVIDLTATTPAWIEAAPANQMISRRNHNLVLLPNGEVIVVGGATHGNNDASADTNCVKMPQIWNPDTLTAGHWYSGVGSTPFDSSSVRRHYHSTAVLLPDGRVLCAGGNKDLSQQTLADLYSPYYLFNTDGSPRARPVFSDVQTTLSYGETFPVCMTSGGPAVTRFTLLRPGSTTHGFDQNQRFVELSAQAVPAVSGKPRFLVSAPADSFAAPPGDYLLFALTSNHTPAIARWVRLRATNTVAGAPSTATLVKVCAQPTSVELEWSPPTVDAATGATNPGPAAQYDLRYRVGAMPTLTEFLTATGALAPAPIDPVPVSQEVLRQSATISSLTPSTSYTVRLRSKNFTSGQGNWSALGNALTFTTYEEECGGGAGGGGGGCCQEGASARRAPKGFWLRRQGGGSDPAFLENTLLPNVVPGTRTADLMRLPYGPAWSSAGARLRLSRSGRMATHYTRVRLVGVSLAEGQSAFVSDGAIVAGTLAPPSWVAAMDGRDLLSLMQADSAFEGHAGDTLELGFADGTPARLALETSRAHLVMSPGRTGIDLQCETAAGWVTVAHHDVREQRSDALFDVPSPGHVRLVFRGDHRLHGIGRFTPGAAPTLSVYEPATATHSRLGDVAASLSSGGAAIAPGEHMLAQFGVTAEQGAGFDWFLEVSGEHTTVAGSGTGASGSGRGESAPLRFALEPNRPNPFGGTTHIGFELPQRSRVRLEVFDLLGRRVAILADATFEPGRHSVEWDGRSSAGSRLPAGIYSYRYSAGTFTEQRQMIVLQ